MQEFLTNTAAFETHGSVFFVRKEWKTGFGGLDPHLAARGKHRQPKLSCWLCTSASPLPGETSSRSDRTVHVCGFTSLWPLFLQCQPSRTWFPEIQLRSHSSFAEAGMYQWLCPWALELLWLFVPLDEQLSSGVLLMLWGFPQSSSCFLSPCLAFWAANTSGNFVYQRMFLICNIIMARIGKYINSVF